MPVDLHALLRHAGATLHADPVPGPDGTTEVGTLFGLPCWHLSIERSAAGRLASSIARRGRPGLLCLTTPTHHLVTVAVAPIRFASIDALGALPLQRLARLRPLPGEPALAAALRLADALDVDAAGRQTFATIRGLLDLGVDGLGAVAPRPVRHAWVLLQLTRLLFLRFLESEGWLAGDPRFLASRLDDALTRGRDPYRTVFAPLCFGTLNRAWRERSPLVRGFGAIPYLNGGLFETHAIERRHTFRLPRRFWRDATDRLVSRTEVTLDRDPLDGRITPEMLGRVFEGVMATDERKAAGAFFTPPALVRAIVHETLVAHFAARLGRSEQAIADALREPDAELRRAMLGVRLLDPAAGSGAFLIGALDLLHGPGALVPAIVRHLVTRRLFGIDRNPAAVRIAELRLWLEVLRGYRGHPAHGIPRLPNLDTTIRTGDTLLGPDLSGLAPGDAGRLRKIHRRAEAAHGSAKRSILHRLRRAEAAILRKALTRREALQSELLLDALRTASAPSLFGDRSPVPAASRERIRELRARRRAARLERRRLDAGTLAAPFSAEIAMAPVLARGGFDLVVGNPPWVRGDHLPARQREALAARYGWWRSSSGAGFRQHPDLAVAFVERSFGLLRDHGTFGLLLPVKLVTADYASTMRAHLVQQATLHRAADLEGHPSAAFDATTYPLALIASRRRAAEGHHVGLGLGDAPPRTPQASWRRRGTWSLGAPAVERLVEHLARTHPAIGDTLHPALGAKTGADAIFLDPSAIVAAWTRPAIRGRDVAPFRVRGAAPCLWPADARGIPWRTLPAPLASHLAPHADRLRRRADLQAGPWWRIFRVTIATAPCRVIWSDIARRLTAAVPLPAQVPLNSCYVAAVGDDDQAHALAAWLNSSFLDALARRLAPPAAGGYRRFSARIVAALPLPSAALTDAELVALGRAGACGAACDDALDRRVGELLGLDRADRDRLLALAAPRR